jgi:hypothetical protein
MDDNDDDEAAGAADEAKLAEVQKNLSNLRKADAALVATYEGLDLDQKIVTTLVFMGLFGQLEPGVFSASQRKDLSETWPWLAVGNQALFFEEARAAIASRGDVAGLVQRWRTNPPPEPPPKPKGFSEERDLTVLVAAFACAWRYAKAPTDEAPPAALLWAATAPGDLDALVDRINEHPAVRFECRVAAVYGGELLLTDVKKRSWRADTPARMSIKRVVLALSASDLAPIVHSYHQARLAGRLSTFDDINEEWAAATTQRDVDTERLCAWAHIDLTRLGGKLKRLG